MRAILKNPAEVRRKSDYFLALNERELATSLESTGRVAVRYVFQFPRFKPRSGKTQKATKARVIRTAGGRLLRLTNTAKHAGALESGAKPHDITGNPWLVFKGRDGQWRRVRRVKHPGNKPYRFMSSAHQAGNAYFKGDMIRRMTALASRF